MYLLLLASCSTVGFLVHGWHRNSINMLLCLSHLSNFSFSFTPLSAQLINNESLQLQGIHGCLHKDRAQEGC